MKGDIEEEDSFLFSFFYKTEIIGYYCESSCLRLGSENIGYLAAREISLI